MANAPCVGGTKGRLMLEEKKGCGRRWHLPRCVHDV